MGTLVRFEEARPRSLSEDFLGCDCLNHECEACDEELRALPPRQEIAERTRLADGYSAAKEHFGSYLHYVRAEDLESELRLDVRSRERLAALREEKRSLTESGEEIKSHLSKIKEEEQTILARR